MNNWKNLWCNLKDPIIESIKYPHFLGYFIFLIIGVSGFGIWITFSDAFNEIYKGGELNLALISFSIVLLLSSGIDILSDKNSDKNGLSIIGLVGFVLSIIMILLLFILKNPLLNYFLWGFYIISILVWWISNGDKDIFKKEIVNMKELDNKIAKLEKPTRK